MSHAYQDRVSLEMARIVAAGLPDHPEWLELARKNLDNWSKRNADAPRLVRNYDEWRHLLDLPVAEICALLTGDTDHSHRLRHNSPFAGALPPDMVWDIKRRFRDESTAA